MNTKQYFVVFLVAVVMMLVGGRLGVNHYKNSCEKIMSADQTQTWLECKI